METEYGELYRPQSNDSKYAVKHLKNNCDNNMICNDGNQMETKNAGNSVAININNNPNTTNGLNATTLDINNPYGSDEGNRTAVIRVKPSCTCCNITFSSNTTLKRHMLSAKHISCANKQKQINPDITKYECTKCDLKFRDKHDLNRHLLTKLHNETKEGLFSCSNCEKQYTHRSGLWKHMQKCSNDQSQLIESKEDKGKNVAITPELIMLLIQQNKEMQQMIFELAKNGGNNNNTNNSNNTINNDNKSFNLNFFLNETCKNAMNLSDFVNGVDISLDDFEETGRIGYVEGLSRVFCKELKKLHFTERPIHCSDLKRETIYIRENNRWEKDENKERLLRAVKQIGKKNINVLTLWQEKYPAYKDVESKENDRYLHILTNILSGETEEEIQSNYGKIMKNISKVTVVDKH